MNQRGEGLLPQRRLDRPVLGNVGRPDMVAKKSKATLLAGALAVAQQVLAHEEVRRRLAEAPRGVIDWASKKRAERRAKGRGRFDPPRVSVTRVSNAASSPSPERSPSRFRQPMTLVRGTDAGHHPPAPRLGRCQANATRQAQASPSPHRQRTRHSRVRTRRRSPTQDLSPTSFRATRPARRGRNRRAACTGVNSR